MATLLEMLGNVADIPGAAIRNTLALENPLAPLLSPLSQDGRASGQEVLSKWGMGDDHDMLGMALEFATDPLSWMGAGAVKAGAKGLGLAGKASSAYSKAKSGLRYASQSPARMKKAAGLLKGRYKSDLLPLLTKENLMALPFREDVQQLAKGGTLLAALNAGRSSDDDVVNGYLGNIR